MKTFLVDIEEVTSYQVPIMAKTEGEARERVYSLLDQGQDVIDIGTDFDRSIKEVNEYSITDEYNKIAINNLELSNELS